MKLGFEEFLNWDGMYEDWYRQQKEWSQSLRQAEDHLRKARKIGALTLNLEEHPIQHRKI